MRINWLAAIAGATIFLFLEPSAVKATKPAMSPRPAVILSRTEQFVALNRWNAAALYSLLGMGLETCARRGLPDHDPGFE